MERVMESASLSARGDGPAQAVPHTQALIREIFASIACAEEVLALGRGAACDLSGPICRIDNGAPTYSPEAVNDNRRSPGGVDANREPSLIETLQLIRDRIDELRASADYNLNTTRSAYSRLCDAV